MDLRSPGGRINVSPVDDDAFFHSTGDELAKRWALANTYLRRGPSPLPDMKSPHAATQPRFEERNGRGAAAETATARWQVPIFVIRTLNRGVTGSASTAARLASGSTSTLTGASRAFLRAYLARAHEPASNTICYEKVGNKGSHSVGGAWSTQIIGRALFRISGFGAMEIRSRGIRRGIFGSLPRSVLILRISGGEAGVRVRDGTLDGSAKRRNSRAKGTSLIPPLRGHARRVPGA